MTGNDQQTRRIAFRLASWLLVAACLLTVSAEAQPAKERAGAARRSKPTATLERARRARREAVAALSEAISAARRFDDPSATAELLTEAADALWLADEEASRAAFRRAWEAAARADRAGEKADNDAPALVASRDSLTTARHSLTTARDYVLEKVAARSPQLAESFMQELLGQLAEEREQRSEATQTSTSERSPWGTLSEAGRRRLGLALALLERGEARRAVEVAASQIAEGVSADFILFLLRARAESPLETDALYLRLVAATERNPSAGANEVLLLSSYVVSPDVLVVVDETGGLMFRPVHRGQLKSAPEEVSQGARAAFFRAAEAMLLRPLPAAIDAASKPRPAQQFYAISRLLPFLARAASTRTPELHARLAALSAELEAARREALSTQTGLFTLTQKNPSDPLSHLVDEWKGARDRQSRDRKLYELVRVAARLRLWERGRTASAQIEDEALRASAQRIITLRQIEHLARDFADASADDFERAANFVRAADAPPLARASGFAQSAALAARKGRPERARELIAEAAQAAAATEPATRARLAAYGLVAGVAAAIDGARAWELLRASLAAANALEEREGEGASLVEAETRDEAEESEMCALRETFHADELFATMARLDFWRALEEVRTLRREMPRAYALVAVARAVLETPQPRAVAHAGR